MSYKVQHIGSITLLVILCLYLPLEWPSFRACAQAQDLLFPQIENPATGLYINARNNIRFIPGYSLVDELFTLHLETLSASFMDNLDIYLMLSLGLVNRYITRVSPGRHWSA